MSKHTLYERNLINDIFQFITPESDTWSMMKDAIIKDNLEMVQYLDHITSFEIRPYMELSIAIHYESINIIKYFINTAKPLHSNTNNIEIDWQHEKLKIMHEMFTRAIISDRFNIVKYFVEDLNFKVIDDDRLHDPIDAYDFYGEGLPSQKMLNYLVEHDVCEESLYIFTIYKRIEYESKYIYTILEALSQKHPKQYYLNKALTLAIDLESINNAQVLIKHGADINVIPTYKINGLTRNATKKLNSAVRVMNFK